MIGAGEKAVPSVPSSGGHRHGTTLPHAFPGIQRPLVGTSLEFQIETFQCQDERTIDQNVQHPQQRKHIRIMAFHQLVERPAGIAGYFPPRLPQGVREQGERSALEERVSAGQGHPHLSRAAENPIDDLGDSHDPAVSARPCRGIVTSRTSVGTSLGEDSETEAGTVDNAIVDETGQLHGLPTRVERPKQPLGLFIGHIRTRT